jgi:hypothetical protein
MHIIEVTPITQLVVRLRIRVVFLYKLKLHDFLLCSFSLRDSQILSRSVGTGLRQDELCL